MIKTLKEAALSVLLANPDLYNELATKELTAKILQLHEKLASFHQVLTAQPEKIIGYVDIQQETHALKTCVESLDTFLLEISATKKQNRPHKVYTHHT